MIVRGASEMAKQAMVLTTQAWQQQFVPLTHVTMWGQN